MADAVPIPLLRPVGVLHGGPILPMELAVPVPLGPPAREDPRRPVVAVEAALLVAELLVRAQWRLLLLRRRHDVADRAHQRLGRRVGDAQERHAGLRAALAATAEVLAEAIAGAGQAVVERALR